MTELLHTIAKCLIQPAASDSAAVAFRRVNRLWIVRKRETLVLESFIIVSSIQVPIQEHKGAVSGAFIHCVDGEKNGSFG